MRVAILDDYQQVALASTDWSAVRELAEITVFSEHIARTEALVRVLEPFNVVVAMRERTAFDADRLGRLPNLRLLVTTGMGNAAIDLAAAGARRITVCGTGGIGQFHLCTPATAERDFARERLTARFARPGALEHRQHRDDHRQQAHAGKADRERKRECQVRVACRPSARGRWGVSGEYLKKGAGERSVGHPSQRKPEESGERKRWFEAADAAESEDGGEAEIGVVQDAAREDVGAVEIGGVGTGELEGVNDVKVECAEDAQVEVDCVAYKKPAA